MKPSISEVHRDIAAVAAAEYAALFDAIPRDTPPVIAVGTDTRPTGPAIADTAMRVFLARGFIVRFLGITASPEIMAYVKTDDAIHGFFYVSASHNPVGHNGFKMGLSDGAVLPRETVLPMIDSFRVRLLDDDQLGALLDEISRIDPSLPERITAERDGWKARAEERYRRFLIPDPSTTPREKTEEAYEEADRELARFGIVADFNGSARTTSIDREILPRLGLPFAAYNDQPGRIVHQILPEGAGLDDAAELLRKHHALDSVFEVAYTPDNDGDRGNLVFIDDDGEPRILDAQTVFSLVVLIELADDYRCRPPGPDRASTVVVANGPTSARVDEIAAIFGASVSRAEVGEANVVSLVQQHLQAHRIVPVAGEGSNGGTIKPPATVRDPLSTLLSLRKARAFRLDRVWDRLRGREERSRAPRFYDLAAELPPWTTLPTDDPDAKMQVGAISHGLLKARWERIVADEADRYERLLSPRYGRLVLRFENYEGTRTTAGPGNRDGAETGGLKLRFFDAGGGEQASLWMRGSGTEPVFRVLAECRGTEPELLRELIALHRDQVRRATVNPGT